MTNCILILMPVFNEEKWIERAIESVRSQSHKEWILVIHDNASTDKTSEISSKFASLDSRVKHILLDEPVASWENWTNCANYAFRNLKGDFVMWQAGDDALVEFDYLEEAIKNISRNENSIGCLPIFEMVFSGPDESQNFEFKGQYHSKFKQIRVKSALGEGAIATHAIYGFYRSSFFFRHFYSDLGKIDDYHACDWYWLIAAISKSPLPNFDRRYLKQHEQQILPAADAKKVGKRFKLKYKILDFSEFNSIISKSDNRFNALKLDVKLILIVWFLFRDFRSYTNLAIKAIMKILRLGW